MFQRIYKALQDIVDVGRGLLKLEVETRREDKPPFCMCKITAEDSHETHRIDSSIHLLVERTPRGNDITFLIMGDLEVAAKAIAVFLSTPVDVTIPHSGLAQLVKKELRRYIETDNSWFSRRLKEGEL